MILIYTEDYFNRYLQMYNSILIFNKNVNFNRTPIWIEEYVNKKLKKNKSKSDYFNLFYEMKIKTIYRSCKFIEIIDMIKEIPIRDIHTFIKKCSLIGKIRFNWTVFAFSHFFFLTELSFFCTHLKKLLFFISLHVINFLSTNYYNKKAFLIIKEVLSNQTSKKKRNLIINLKRFDIFFYSENYSRITLFINKLQLLYTKGRLTHKILCEIVTRLGNFFMKKNDFKLAFSYFAENILKTSCVKKMEFYLFLENFSFCITFVKKCYFNFSLSNIKKFSCYSNFRAIRILNDIMRKIEFTKIQKITYQKTKNSKKKFLKINTFTFLNFFLLKFFENISITYIRIDVKFISAMLGIKKTQSKKIIAILNIIQKKKMVFNKFLNYYSFFKKKKIKNFLVTLIRILIQLNTIIS